jgi:hypothetical protein
MARKLTKRQLAVRRAGRRAAAQGPAPCQCAEYDDGTVLCLPSSRVGELVANELPAVIWAARTGCEEQPTHFEAKGTRYALTVDGSRRRGHRRGR